MGEIKQNQLQILNIEIMTPKRITISGNAGSGKSTVAKLLAKQLNYEYVSIGDFSRKYAQEKFNMNINEFQDYCNQHPEEDKMIDEKFMEYCNNKESLVIDYRLGFHFVKDSYNILLTVSDEIAAKRIQKADRTNEITDLSSIHQRNLAMRTRFQKLYKVDFDDKSNYHTVINTDYLMPEDIVKLVMLKWTITLRVRVLLVVLHPKPTTKSSKLPTILE